MRAESLKKSKRFHVHQALGVRRAGIIKTQLRTDHADDWPSTVDHNLPISYIRCAGMCIAQASERKNGGSRSRRTRIYVYVCLSNVRTFANFSLRT